MNDETTKNTTYGMSHREALRWLFNQEDWSKVEYRAFGRWNNAGNLSPPQAVWLITKDDRMFRIAPMPANMWWSPDRQEWVDYNIIGGIKYVREDVSNAVSSANGKSVWMRLVHTSATGNTWVTCHPRSPMARKFLLTDVVVDRLGDAGENNES